MIGKATDATEANHGADEANAVNKAAAIEAEASVTDEAKARVADEAEIDEADKANFLTDDADANLDEVNEADDIVKTAEADNSDEAIESDEADDANKVNKAIALDKFD